MFLPRPLSSLIRFLAACAADARSRRQLMAMDDRLLRDIGITRDEARWAATRPYWRRSRSWPGTGTLERRRARAVATHTPKC
jgi:uncharacterized protein YjiS (DUF1127 family)